MNSYLYITALLFVFLTASCRKDKLPYINNLPIEVELKFNVGTPVSKQQSLSTYSISSDDENSIQDIILLAFKVPDAGVETLEYYKEGMQIYAGSSSNEKSFYASLLKSEDNYRFVLLINGGEQISNIVEGLENGTEKDAVMEQLICTIGGKWNAASSASFTPLPMWGESEVVEGIDAQTVLPDIGLLRSLARVDVRLDPLLTNHVITGIYLSNANNQASMAPFSSSFDGSLLKQMTMSNLN